MVDRLHFVASLESTGRSRRLEFVERAAIKTSEGIPDGEEWWVQGKSRSHLLPIVYIRVLLTSVDIDVNNVRVMGECRQRNIELRLWGWLNGDTLVGKD